MAGTDYGQQLRQTLDSARQAIITQRQNSTTLRGQTAATLGHAEQTLSVDDENFKTAQADYDLADQIYKIAVQGGVLVQNADALAARAAEAAAAATAAMATAATSVKALADSLDTLSAQTAGVYAIAHNDDSPTSVSEVAEKALILTTITSNSAELLKMSALDANVEAAQTTAAATSLSVSSLGTEMMSMVDRSKALLDTAGQQLDARRQTDTQSVQSEKGALQAYNAARMDNGALITSLDDINFIANGALEAHQGENAQLQEGTLAAHRKFLPISYARLAAMGEAELSGGPGPVENQPTLGFTYYLLNVLTLPPVVEAGCGDPSILSADVATKGCRFFAVPLGDLPLFNFDTAISLIAAAAAKGGDSLDNPSTHTWVPLTPPNPPEGTPEVSTFEGTLFHDTQGAALEIGRSYAVFAFREPMAGYGTAHASDLSLPTDPIQLVYKIPNAPADATVKVETAPSDNQALPLFQVTFTPVNGDTTNLTAEARSLIMRADVYRTVNDDLDAIANSVGSSNYISLTPGTAYIYRQGDTDVYGDILLEDTHYVCLVLLVSGTGTPPGGFLVPSSVDNTPNVLLAPAPFLYKTKDDGSTEVTSFTLTEQEQEKERDTSPGLPGLGLKELPTPAPGTQPQASGNPTTPPGNPTTPPSNPTTPPGNPTTPADNPPTNSGGGTQQS
ncbi:hypothetical protein POL68_32895 [Stigmatella sp. ncwal1]|uniref:Uncharacterized protein n=1 Tax=Stigmatella ashevillensis TaxID=2995309 RepID=A0ABT5DI21_9BACT|nr:hypothetical protein [Stigmatella ashevillena]MDC0713307.1 hypothetical protein [Stigmatella ashevillena]